MALLAEIIAGMEIGNTATDIVVRYSKSQYMEKITKLQGILSRLDQHYSNLEGLRERLKNIWDDDQSAKYHKNLEKQIKAVKNAQENTKNQIDMWEAAIREMEDTVGAQQDKIDLVSQALGALDIKD